MKCCYEKNGTQKYKKQWEKYKNNEEFILLENECDHIRINKEKRIEIELIHIPIPNFIL